MSIHASAQAVADPKVIPLRRPSDRDVSAPRAFSAPEIHDLDWIVAIREGDEHLFEQIFLVYFDRLQSFAERYVDHPEVAEELVGNVFLRLWQQREQWNLRQNLKSYLYAAVRNQALMWLDHQRVVRRTDESGKREQQSPGMGQGPPAADEELQALELAAAVASAIDRLPERPREVFLLSRQHGLSYAEIAEAMNLSVKTVENHLGRALKALRRELAVFLE